jgi:hypothetical protein
MKKITITIEEDGKKASAILNEQDVINLEKNWGIEAVQLMYNVLTDEIKREKNEKFN